MIKIKDLPILPKAPGCYIYKNDKDQIIYIGKAKDISKRVKSYFTKKNHDPKTTELLKYIESIEFIQTKTETEALILENNLIKKNRPKYNIDLKDSKRYAYIRLSPEQFPRLLIARNKNEKGTYFGPFTSAAKRDYILKTLQRSFKLRTCKRFPKKPCLRFHIDLCNAPCTNNISIQEYNKKIEIISSILKGKTKEIKESLNQEMNHFSRDKEYEYALERRNQIDAIEYLEEKQSMEKKKDYDQDIISYIVKDKKVFLMLFNIHKGILENKTEFEFKESIEFFEEFILQYYSENKIPKEFILPKKISDSLIKLLEQKKGSRLTITIPKRGEKKTLLGLVKTNIENTFFAGDEKLERLKIALNMQDTPRVIECFDISHLSGAATVGSMVQFRNARPDKSNYRRFKVKSVEFVDDYESIREVVLRRYYRIKMEKTELPDLIIIDGGKGQLSAALESLEKLDIRVPIISIAKEFEEIFIPGNTEPIRLDQKNKALLLIREIRDEAHRFAINYNRLLRKKSMFEQDER